MKSSFLSSFQETDPLGRTVGLNLRPKDKIVQAKCATNVLIHYTTEVVDAALILAWKSNNHTTQKMKCDDSFTPQTVIKCKI